MQLLQMCPGELEQARQNKAILMFGVGSIEYHGSQLPLGTDFFLVDGVIQAVEKRLPDKVVAAPSLAVSPTGFAVSGPQAGTVDIGVDAFMHHCADLLDSYERMGFHKIVILVHHQGGNIIPMLKTVLTKHTMYEKKAELGEGWWTDKRPGAVRRAPVELLPAMLDTHYFGGHGGKGETEGVLAIRPDLVHLEKVTNAEEEPFWNKSVTEVDEAAAKEQFADLIRLWVEKIESM